MTLVEAPASTSVELLLAELLDREWAAQSGRAAPLERTVAVRTLLELVLAGTRGGMFAAERVAGETPEEIVAELRDELPGELSPWTRRSLERVGALRFSMPLLPAGEPTRAVAPPSEPPALGPGDVPELPAQEPAPEPAAGSAPGRSLAVWLGVAIVAVLLGAGIAAGAAVDLAPAVLGAAAALAAAVLALAVGGGRR